MYMNLCCGFVCCFVVGLLVVVLGLGGSFVQVVIIFNLSYNGVVDSEKNLVYLFVSNFKCLVEEKSGGELQFKFYFNSMFGEEEQCMEQVMIGFGLNIVFFVGIVLLFLEIYVSVMFFMFKDVVVVYVFFDSGSYWQVVCEVFCECIGIELLVVVEEGGFFNFINGKKLIYGLVDFQGLCFCVMDFSQVVFYEVFGVFGMLIFWIELYMGLCIGVVDGQMNLIFYIIFGSFYQVQKYLILVNIQYFDQFLVVNGDLFVSFLVKECQVLFDVVVEVIWLNCEVVVVQQECDFVFFKEKGMQIIQLFVDDFVVFCEKGQLFYLVWLKIQDIELCWIEMVFCDVGFVIVF